MSSNCYLVARDTKTNDFEIKGEFSSLKEADLYTTNYHNDKDLANATWSGIVPKQEIDFFIVMPFIYGKEVGMKIQEVLFSNSKEIRMITDHQKELNTLTHFIDKIESSNEFLDSVPSYLYEEIKNYLLSEDENKTLSYQNIREIILSFNISKHNSKNEDLYRLLIERKLLSKFDENYNEKQLSIEIEEEKEDSDKIVEVMSSLHEIGENFFEIKDGTVRVSNNIYTTEANLELLDSLLDQRLGFILYDYAINKNSIEPNEELLKEAELNMIQILSSERSVLNDTYRLVKILNNKKSKLVGDTNGKQYRKN